MLDDGASDGMMDSRAEIILVEQEEKVTAERCSCLERNE